MNILRQIGSSLSLGGPLDDMHPRTSVKLSLHLGVHKTASTHLQGILQAAAPRLAAQGMAYIGPQEVRTAPIGLNDLTGSLPKVAAAHRFQRRIAGFDHVLVSDENLLGTMESNFLTEARSPGIYRDGAQRIGRILDSLGVGDAQVFLALRDPAAYYASCYRFHIKQKGFLTWSQYSARRDLREVSWVSVIRGLHALPQVSRVVLWRAEDYPAVAPKVLAEMLGPQWAGLPIDAQRANRGLTNKQVAQRYAQAGADPDYPGRTFRAFGKAARDRSARRYAREVERLARLPRVTLLMP